MTKMSLVVAAVAALVATAASAEPYHKKLPDGADGARSNVTTVLHDRWFQLGDDAYAQSSAFAQPPVWGAGTRPSSSPYLAGGYNNRGR